MIQTYQIIAENVSSINKILSTGGSQVQKIFSTSRYICFQIRVPGQNVSLFLGRGKGYEGLWIGEKLPTPFLRKRDRLLEYLRKNLKNGFNLRIELDENDRIIIFKFVKNKTELVFSYFWKGRESYFLFKDDTTNVFLSWAGKQNDKSIKLMEHFDLIGRTSINKEKAKDDIDIVQLLDNEEKEVEKKSIRGKLYKRRLRTIEYIKGDIERVKLGSSLKDKLISEDIVEIVNSEEKKLNFNGLKFNLSLCENYYQKRDVIFKKIKRLEKAQTFLENRLENEIQKVESGTVLENSLKMIEPIWNMKKKEEIISNIDEYKEIKLKDFRIALGLNIRGNDQIRTKWANKEDFWFHLDGSKSAHLIAKIDLPKLVENLELISSVLAYYSGVDSSEVNIVYTKVKNLKAVKGSPGKVTYKKEKHLKVRVDIKWQDQL